MSETASTIDDTIAVRARIVELEAALATERELRSQWQHKHDQLLGSYQALERQLELIRRRLYEAKAERIDTTQLELEFASTLAALDALAGTEELAKKSGGTSTGTGAATGCTSTRGKRTPTGRRDLRNEDVPEERIVLSDPTAEDTAERIGTEEACRMMWRRAGWVRVVTERIKYREDEPAVGEVSETSATEESTMPRIFTAPLPPEMIDRSIVTASVWAHIASSKFCFGLPLYRLEEIFAKAGFRIDRGTMSRWLEQLGGTVGATVVEAMRQEALRMAFCIATDATGILIQPIREGDQQRRACRRGHFFVQIADADHVFFEYTPRETSAAVGKMFHGFSGYVQADAKSVYDFLYRPPEERVRIDDYEPDRAVRHEVGCWSHLRTKAWEVAITSKDPVAREMLARITRIFELDRSWKKKPHSEIKSLRELHLRPHVDAFFTFVETEYERVKDQRGLLRSALGYAVRQRGALTRFFDDGRLTLTNNGSERELRRVATGRKAWLFCGSDDHAQAAGNLLTLIASARLHGLDPEQYLRDLFRILPQWPRDRYIELAPKYWAATRARIDAAQLEIEIGWITIPPPPEQAPAS
ncbi:MAG TPA: IS66 family transposase [Casimicrobiaceae bacterium]|nr:IS66 family transposase [Casimicrobiaceae bacterium]